MSTGDVPWGAALDPSEYKGLLEGGKKTDVAQDWGSSQTCSSTDTICTITWTWTKTLEKSSQEGHHQSFELQLAS